MTWAMPDSINVNDLPPGYSAYLGYADGNWPNAQALAERFPQARRIILTVTGTHLEADGVDIEPGNPDAPAGADWCARKLAAAPDSRPVLYASVAGVPGYGMGDVLRELGARGIAPARVRLLSAHYGAGEHVCGPATCKLVSIGMDGTQWTDAFAGVGGRLVDMSLLHADFFTALPAPTVTETIVRELPLVRQGMTGEVVRTVQGLCNARDRQGMPLKIDGVFGWRTQAAVEFLQVDAHISQDGVVGPQTWPVLLGIA